MNNTEYIIRNKINGKYYVGQTETDRSQWTLHQHSARKYPTAQYADAVRLNLIPDVPSHEMEVKPATQQ